MEERLGTSLRSSHTHTPYSNILHGDQDDITALAIQGGAVWLGTRNGYVFVLDAAMMDAGEGSLMGLQYCGQGKVKSIVPLTPWKGVTPRLQVCVVPMHVWHILIGVHQILHLCSVNTATISSLTGCVQFGVPR